MYRMRGVVSEALGLLVLGNLRVRKRTPLCILRSFVCALLLVRCALICERHGPLQVAWLRCGSGPCVFAKQAPRACCVLVVAIVVVVVVAHSLESACDSFRLRLSSLRQQQLVLR